MKPVWKFAACGLLPAVLYSAVMLITPASGQEPEKRSADEIVVTDCQIQLIDSVTLASERPGIIGYVEPDEGDTVRAGQLVAGLKDGVARAAVDIARKESEDDIEVQYAKKAHEVDIAKLAKAKAANIKNPETFPELEIKELKLTAERSRLQIEKAGHDLEVKAMQLHRALEELKLHQIESPFDGVVTRVYKSKGEAVQMGEAILDMVSTRTVKVKGLISISDALKIAPGSLVQVKLSIPDIELEEEKRVFEGRVRFVDVRVIPVAHQVWVWAEVVNQQNILREGLPATMKIFPSRPFAREASGRKPVPDRLPPSPAPSFRRKQ